jgi:hypothetical protein
MKRSEAIDGDTPIEDLLERHPGLAGVFVRIGLPCFVCGEPAWGTVGELCERHGRDLTEVLSALRAAVGKPV